jgi:flagellar hook protein FlgE
MSLFQAMRTSVSGMNAQAGFIGGISQNIANSATVGYKKVDNQFETILGIGSAANYSSGGVLPVSRFSVDEQGTFTSTGSATNLAIQGGGFFIVQNGGGASLLTRAGAFAPDASGALSNTSGYKLMGYDLSRSSGARAGPDALSVININLAALSSTPTKTGSIIANLPSDATPIAAANLPSTNHVGAGFSDKTSLTTSDNLGKAVVLNVYFSKTSTGNWEASVFDASQAAASGEFPYSSGPLATKSIQFNSADGRLVPSSDGLMTIPVPGGASMTLDLSKTTQLASSFAVAVARADGSPPSTIDHIDIGQDGILSGVYKDGRNVDLFKIPLATTPSPEHLTPVDGNAFVASAASGNIVLGDAASGLRGNILSSALESSTVDLGNELTSMIQAQRNYSANSKVFQASADMLDVLMNLKV